jgi:plastocyanin
LRRRKRAKRRSRSKSLALVVLILAIAVVGGLFLSGFNPFSAQGNAPTVVTVIIANGAGLNVQLGFSPALVKVVIGVNNTVVWKNEDSVWHTAHSNIPEFDSKMIPPGASFTHTFQRAGSFPYHCDPHPWMTGLVSVIGSGSTPVYALRHGITMFQSDVHFITKTSDGTE